LLIWLQGSIGSAIVKNNLELNVKDPSKHIMHLAKTLLAHAKNLNGYVGSFWIFQIKKKPKTGEFK
jgi:hypothetical protein